MFDADDMVRAMFAAALGREPDPGALASYGAKLALGHEQIASVGHLIYASDEHRSTLGVQGILDHSQCGEFVMLLKDLVRSGQRHGIIVDVGARGRERSNSYDLLKTFGWRGILVEANPSLYAQINADFARADFTLVECAVGPEEGTLPFYIGSNDDVSSLRRDAAEGWGALKGIVDVPVRRLAAILDDHAVPDDFDVLSLDIEGLDVAVLDDLIGTSAYRPKRIVLEASHNFTTRNLDDIGASRLVQDIYEITEQTIVNLILKLRE